MHNCEDVKLLCYLLHRHVSINLVTIMQYASDYTKCVKEYSKILVS
jgi:hypothetical protein